MKYLLPHISLIACLTAAGAAYPQPADYPSRPILGAMMRATKSDAPPGPKGTTMRIGRDG